MSRLHELRKEAAQMRQTAANLEAEAQRMDSGLVGVNDEAPNYRTAAMTGSDLDMMKKNPAANIGNTIAANPRDRLYERVNTIEQELIRKLATTQKLKEAIFNASLSEIEFGLALDDLSRELYITR